MKYCIKNQSNEIIARFKNESDRDICIYALREEYPDYEFTATESD